MPGSAISSYWWIIVSTVLPLLIPLPLCAQTGFAGPDILGSAAVPPSVDTKAADPAPDAAVSAPAALRAEIELSTWWRDQLATPVGAPESALPMELERAVLQALTQSARVQVLRETAAIATTAIPQAQATFDPVGFLDTRVTDTSDPVGSSLTTGGSGRFIDQNWYSSGGVRKQALSGAKLETAQRMGYENSNSIYFTPQNQATAKLTMNLTQPLLRGAGYAYNNGIIVLANLDSQMAQSQFSADLQNYLVEFHSAFWDIYLQRAVLLQRRRLLHEAREILRELELRRDVDVQVSQLARAKAAVANREASLLRYEAAVKDAVSRFKALVNDPYLENSRISELIPLDSPNAGFGDADLGGSLVTALERRPEITQAMQQMKSCAQRLDIAKSDVLPVLNFVLGAYVSGLQGQSDFGQAFGNQYSAGRPTYWSGLVFERPIGNRGPRAVQEQRVLELQRATSQLRAITATTRAEVEIAVREISTTRGEMISRHQAMLSEQDQASYLLERWRLLPGDQQVAGVVFNDLLDAQDRRAAAEFEFVTSQVAHRVAWIKLRRAIGTLCEVTAATSEDVKAATTTATETSAPAIPVAAPLLPSDAMPEIIPLPPVE
jgi:outer membrane protein